MSEIVATMANVSGNYIPTKCPTCGFIENLDREIDGNWECPICDTEYFIFYVRAVVPADMVSKFTKYSEIGENLTLELN